MERVRSNAAATHSSEALEWIAKRRAKLNRWAATSAAEVEHPKYGAVVVPCASNFAALECAAEYWGCNSLEISDAKVWQAKPGAVPVAMPR